VSDKVIAASMANQSTLSFLQLGNLGKSAWWRYLLGVLIIAAGYLVFGVFWYVLFIVIATGGKLPHIDKAGEIVGLDQMANYVSVNIPSFFLLLFTAMVVCFLHSRPFLTLISPVKFNWRRLAAGFGAWVLLAGLDGLVGRLIFPHSYKFVVPGIEFFAYMPLVLLLTPIQCLSEELFLEDICCRRSVS